MDVEGLATTSSNVLTTESSERKPKDSRTTKLPLVPGLEIPRGTPSSGDMQWQDNVVNKVLDHTLVT